MNFNTHFYLYAKHHYIETDLITDLKKIYAKTYAIPLEYCETNDLITILVSLVYKHVNSEYSFLDFIRGIAPENIWKVGGSSDDAYWICVIRKCLSILRLTNLKDLDLGLVDSNILSIREN